MINHGRTSGATEIPNSMRALIAGEALSGVSAKVLSEEFGISKSSISAYKNGATSTTTYNEPNPELKSKIGDIKDRIIGPAQSRLIKAIEAITDDKLSEAKIQTAASVARDMSTIIKNLEPPADQVVNRNQVIIFRPRMKEEDDYEILQVSE